MNFKCFKIVESCKEFVRLSFGACEVSVRCL